MKIAHVTPHYFADVSLIGGGERYVNNICKALNGLDVVTCADVLSFGTDHRQIRMLGKTALRIFPGIPTELHEVAASNFYSALGEYDFVHIHQCLTPFGLFAASHARLHGCIVIGTDHGGGESHLFLWHPFLFRNFDLLHAQSNFATAAFAEASDLTRVIKGPVDDEAFPIGDPRARDSRSFIAIGRILPHKGFECLIDALPVGCRLTIVGRIYDQEYYQFLLSRIDNKPVHIFTTLEDSALLQKMHHAGLGLHASLGVDFRGRWHLKSELLGFAPLECMCAGLPVICSSTAALRELDQMPGCRTFRNQEELGSLLRDYLNGAIGFPPAHTIRDSVQERYGLKQFGMEYIKALAELKQCAS